MTDYKNTLNLPQTSFPMKANLAQREPELLAKWQATDLYANLRKARTGAKRFILHDGPPYANGHLHCGHALNKILKDIIVKSKSFSGFDAPFVPGWDCHGLPIELNVEKKYGKAGVKISAAEFREKSREYAASQLAIQREEFQRLGVLGDWYNPYATMDYSYEANIVRSLGRLIANGHVQQGFKPVHWCIDCRSALAEAEVDYEEKTSSSIDVAMYAVDSSQFLAAMKLNVSNKALIVPIWTTTPWTLPANEAVCLNPALEYSLVDTEHAYILLATELMTASLARFGIDTYQVLGCAFGKVFESLLLKHPFYSRQVPIVLGEHVTTEAGTGCVHTAPAHGPDDYLVGVQYKLPLISPVMANGCYAETVELFAGLSVTKADAAVITILQEHNTLLNQSSMTHSYPHCWRHKTPVIFRATPQWFVSMDNQALRADVLTSIDTVTWLPDWGKARMNTMVATRPDWCISRQRAWGTPMTLFIHKQTRALHPKTLEWILQIATLIETQGIEAWFELDADKWLGDDAPEYEKSNDTLDVWFDSGVSHACVLEQRASLEFPADLYIEGSDQYRGWFNSSLITSVAMRQTAPYKMVISHGYTVDAEGRKLSKSKGNYVELDKLVRQHGADILRLWVSSTDYRHEVSISDEIIKRTGDAYRRIRNTARFLLANLFDFNPKTDVLAETDLVELDRWAIKRAQQLQVEILEAYEQYQFHVIYQKIHNFCAVEMGGFYLDIIKDRQYTAATNSPARRSCQTAMFHIIHALTRWLAPLISFTAEELWSAIPGNEAGSIFIQQWYQDWPEVTEVELVYWQQIQLVRDEVNKALETKRQAGDIGSSLAAGVILYANDTLYPLLARLGDELRFVLITSSAKLRPLPSGQTLAFYNETLGLAVQVEACQETKCVRCWHRCDDIGTDATHPELCSRCVTNLSEQGESRYFA